MGIPTAQVCSMKQVAQMVGSPRIVTGKSVLHPTGDPGLGADAEKSLRRKILVDALKKLASGNIKDAA